MEWTMPRQDLWKLKREAGRAFFRLWDGLARPLRGLRTALYDRRRAGLVTVHPGRLPSSGKVAIHVIYQPQGVTASTLFACDWLQRNGYAPLLVSNAPISDPDLARLKARSWLTVVRPNVGYDFGAYRDGIWVLRNRARDISRLLLMNDSIWVPLSGDPRMLQAVESDAMGGAVFVARPGRSRRNAHFQSFFVGFSQAVLSHPSFDRYWQQLPLSGQRRVVLSEGEKGLTQAVQAAGFAHSVTPSGQMLLDRLRAEDAPALQLVLDYSTHDDPSQAKATRDLLAAFQPTEAWRRQALAHFARVLSGQSPMNSFPVGAILFLGTNFLKKGNNLPIYAATRWQYLRAVANGVLPAPAPEIMAEIEASQLDRRSPTDTIPAPPA
jgi:hypothetical protein